MSDSEIHHLGAAYALDALDDRERAAFEAHLSTCGICRADVREMRETAADLSRLIVETPPPGLRASVLDEIARTRQLSPLPGAVVRLGDHRSRRIAVGLSAVAAALLVAVGAFVVGSRTGTDFGDEVAALLSEPGAGVAQLEGSGGGTVTVVWNDDEAAFVAAGLPAPPPGTAYELWLIDTAGEPRPMRLLAAPDSGRIEAFVPLADGVAPAAWGVTVEPVGGSDAPTSDVLFSAPVDA
jgi:anti-sigma-K factor RskA